MIRVMTFSHDSGSVEYSAEKCSQALNEFLEQNPAIYLCNHQVQTAATVVGTINEGFYYTFTITAVLIISESETSHDQ